MIDKIRYSVFRQVLQFIVQSMPDVVMI